MLKGEAVWNMTVMFLAYVECDQQIPANRLTMKYTFAAQVIIRKPFAGKWICAAIQ